MVFSSARWTADRRAAWREGAAVAALFLLLAVIVTWPLVAGLGTLLGAPEGAGDPALNLWILGWDLRVLFETPAHILTGRVFDAPVFHPARQTLAYSDHLLVQAVLVSPVYLVTRDVVVSYNVLWVASIWASALAMWWYAREVTGHRIGAIVAGLAWGFSAYRMAHVVHLQLQALYFLPLAALAVHRVVARRRLRDGVWLGLWYGLTALGSAYYAVIGAIGLGALLIGLVAGAGRSRLAHLARPLAVGALVSTALVLPVLVPYVQVQQREGFARTLDEAARHAASWQAYASDPPWRPVSLAPVGRTEEDALRPGWGVLLLAGLALGSLRTRVRRPHVWAWLMVAAVGLVLSFGPDGLRDVYGWAHRWIFGFHAVRAPARFGVLVTFATASLAAYGVAWAAGRSSAVRGLAVVGVLLVAGEAAAWRLPVRAAPVLDTAVNRWLRGEPGPGAVVHLPLPADHLATGPMLGTLVHGRPIVNGYSGQRPTFYGAIEQALASFPSADALWTIHDLDVRFIVWPDAGLEADWPLVHRAALTESDGTAHHVYELRDEDTLRTVLGDEAGVVPPEPGPAPFRSGEEAVYDVFWDGAGRTVSAGTARVRVDHADPADVFLPDWVDAGLRERLAWRVSVVVETAPWMARVFEAHDTFVTWADDQFFPLVHRRALREGRRRVDQSVLFDDEVRALTIVDPAAPAIESGFRLRVPRDVRDPLTALLLVRTLPLDEAASLPITDMGRTSTLETGAPATDTIEWSGTPTPTLRVRPVLTQRVARRAPLAIDVWLSGERGWLPLRAEVSAGFGRVRLELRP